MAISIIFFLISLLYFHVAYVEYRIDKLNKLGTAISKHIVENDPKLKAMYDVRYPRSVPPKDA